MSWQFWKGAETTILFCWGCWIDWNSTVLAVLRFCCSTITQSHPDALEAYQVWPDIHFSCLNLERLWHCTFAFMLLDLSPSSFVIAYIHITCLCLYLGFLMLFIFVVFITSGGWRCMYWLLVSGPLQHTAISKFDLVLATSRASEVGWFLDGLSQVRQLNDEQHCWRR